MLTEKLPTFHSTVCLHLKRQAVRESKCTRK